MCPVKPAIADGRLFVRTMNRLLCYDLRKPADLDIDTIAARCTNPMLGYPADAFTSELKLRVVGGAPVAVYATVPLRSSDGRASMSPPASGDASAVELTDRELSGSIKVRVNHHHEPWTVKATRDGSRIEGTCTRVIEPLKAPLQITGRIDGKIEKKPGGAAWWIFSCLGAASQQPQNPKFARQPAHLVVATYADGSRHAWARAGRVNRSTHEVDPSELTIAEASAKGTLTVIYHGDAYVPGNPETGGALAATYTLDAAIADGKITGTYKGVLGVPFQQSVKLAGSYSAGKDLHEVAAE
jgi:hypothetical protein